MPSRLFFSDPTQFQSFSSSKPRFPQAFQCLQSLPFLCQFMNPCTTIMTQPANHASSQFSSSGSLGWTKATKPLQHKVHKNANRNANQSSSFEVHFTDLTDHCDHKPVFSLWCSCMCYNCASNTARLTLYSNWACSVIEFSVKRFSLGLIGKQKAIPTHFSMHYLDTVRTCYEIIKVLFCRWTKNGP